MKDEQEQPRTPVTTGNEKRLSESEAIQIAAQVAAPVLGGVAGALASHLMGKHQPDQQQAPPEPPHVELPPGVHPEE